MTRIVIERGGVTTDVPENELLEYLKAGFVKVSTLPDALPEKDQKPTAEELAVNEAALKVAQAQLELDQAQLDASAARSNPAPSKKADSG